MSRNELYDKVSGIDFDALFAKTGIPADDLRAWDREVVGEGIEILMEERRKAESQRDRLAAYASDLERGGVSLGHIKRARAKHLHDGDMEGLA